MDDVAFVERTPDEQAVESVLHEFGVFGGERHDELVKELAGALGGGEWWDEDRIASRLHVKQSLVGKLLSRYGIKRQSCTWRLSRVSWKLRWRSPT